MFQSYIKLALRNLYKNKLYAGINIFGLALGLTIFVLALLINDYEKSYDTFFKNADRIYTVNAKFTPNSGQSIQYARGVQSALPPLLRAENPDIIIAQDFGRQVLTNYEDKRFYETVHFVERDFHQIFDLTYVDGDGELAANDPTALIISESAATKYFGDEDPIGKTILISNEMNLTVKAVYQDLPINSHFVNNLIIPSTFDMIAPIEAWVQIFDYDMTGNWSNLSGNYMNYFLLPENKTIEEVEATLESIYQRHTDDDRKRFLGGFRTTKLADQNTFVWEATGLPVLESLLILGFLILLVACLNYTNLATAQALGRLREVGLRKSMGASKTQLFAQFLIESTVIAFISLVIALGFIELIIPLINNSMNKDMGLNILTNPALFASLIGIVSLVGLISGSYPAHVIANIKTANILRGTMVKGNKGVMFRNIMLVVQFMISIFMMTMVTIIYLQNEKVSEASAVFPKEQTVILRRINQVQDYKQVLKNRITALEGVEIASYIRQEPFEQSDSSGSFFYEYNGQQEEASLFVMNGDEDFFDIMNFQMLAGRQFDKNIALDIMQRDEEFETDMTEVNIILNESAMRRLQISSPQEAIGQTLKSRSGELNYNIVGVVKDVNYMGYFNDLKPYVFRIDPRFERVLAVKIKGGMIPETVAEIDRIWEETIPDFPVQRQFLDDKFDEMFVVFESINLMLLMFAVVSLVLASIGLFGMAAFMAEKRTREIGVRKVMGASISSIVKMLVWQFSKPVLWALVFGLTLGVLGSMAYIQFFADRAELSPFLFVGIALFSLAVGWLTVSFHAWRVARSNPIKALRYE